MINICIVEDQVDAVLSLQENLRLFGEKSGTEYAVKHYDSADEMMSQYVPGVYEILFLDIMLPGTDGMTAAKQVRDRDDRVIIIFVTNERNLAVEGYSVGALDYIVKPVEKYAFFTSMEQALRSMGRNASIRIQIDTANGPYFLDSAEITYVEVFNHTLVYHTGKQSFEEWASLRTAEKKLCQYGFERCSNSHLVNLRYVTEVTGDALIVAGETIRLTRGKRQGFLRRLNNFYIV